MEDSEPEQKTLTTETVNHSVDFVVVKSTDVSAHHVTFGFVHPLQHKVGCWKTCVEAMVFFQRHVADEFVFLNVVTTEPYMRELSIQRHRRFDPQNQLVQERIGFTVEHVV